MGCCSSSTAEDPDIDPDAPRATRKEAKTKILTTEPSHLEMHECECDLNDIGTSAGMYEQDEELLAKAEAEASAKRAAGKAAQRAAEEAEEEARREAEE
eukprot:2993687-Prymnesium_polylepis.1